MPTLAFAAADSGTVAEIPRPARAQAGQLPLENDGWWGHRTGGYVGAIMGTSLGILGAVIGTLGGMGRARGLVTALHIGGIVVGVVCLAVGLVALVLGQPYAVYYPLLLTGFIATVVLGSLYPAMRRGYEQRELRRMQAVDA